MKRETPRKRGLIFFHQHLSSIWLLLLPIGPAKVFGLFDGGNRNGLPLIRAVNDYYDEDTNRGWMPTGHKNGHRPLYNGEDGIPPSLVEAINAFIFACAIRKFLAPRKVK